MGAGSVLNLLHNKYTSFASDGPNCTANISVYGFTVYNPMVIPACLLAVIIGLYGGRVVRTLAPKVGSYSYSISYTMYCYMMWHSMLIHCITPTINNIWVTFVVGLIDAGLTSSIAASFMFNAFVDNQWISESSCKGKALMFGTYIAIFVAWAVSLLRQWQNAFLVLYVGVIAMCCGLFLVAELYYLARNNWNGVCWLIVGGLCGGVGLVACVNPVAVCAMFGKWLNASFWWDILSDLAMMALLKYVFASRTDATIPASTCNSYACRSADNNSHELQQVTTVDPTPAAGAAQTYVYVPVQYSYPGQSFQL